MYYFNRLPLVWAVRVNNLVHASALISCLRVVKYDQLHSCFQPNDNTILYFLLHVEYSQDDYGGITLGGRDSVCQWNFNAQRQQLLG